MRMSLVPHVAVVASALLLASCQLMTSGTPASDVAVTAVSGTLPPITLPVVSPLATPSVSASLTPTPAAFQGTRGPVEKAPIPAPPVTLLTDVRVGRHDGFDRVAFEFRGALPGYRVVYVQPPILQDASGLPVTIAGSAFVQLRFTPASGYGPGGEQTELCRGP